MKKFVVMSFRSSDRVVVFEIRDRLTGVCDNTFVLSLEDSKGLIANLQDLIDRNE